MRVPMLDLRRQHAALREEVMQAAARVIDAQAFILGPEVGTLEAEVAARLGAARAVGVACGSDALLLGLLAAGVRPGDEVVTTPFSFIATAEAIARAGATPVFADIEDDSFNLAPEGALERFGPRTRAVVPVHLYGRCARMDPLLRGAAAAGVAVVEDAAQAIDASRGGRFAGAMGELGCLSFFPSKNLGGWGDGGMVLAREPELADRVARLRAHGGSLPYRSEEVGVNSRLDALQAAVLRVKLRHLTTWTEARRAAAGAYGELFAQAGLLDAVRPPPPDLEGVHVYNQFTVRCERRDELAAALATAGIGSAVYYRTPLHLQPCFAGLGHHEGDFPAAERASREVLSLPVHPELTRADQELVVEAIRLFYRGRP